MISMISFGHIERQMIYFPEKRVEVTPEKFNVPYDEVLFETENNEKICGWYLPHPQARGTVLFCHGNAGNVSHRLDKLFLLQKAQVSIMIFDYPGYGRSQGNPTEAGLYQAADSAYRYLREKRKVSPENIIVYGESLGGAVAIEVASTKPVGGVITEGAFTSIMDMAKQIYPFIPSFVIRARFDSIAKIHTISALKLFIHSRDDEIVPFDMGKRLFEHAPFPKQFFEMKGSHNYAFSDSQDKYVKIVTDFVAALSKEP